ncbi:DNA polymerase domain-containing protein [Halovivax sp.]|uniref:DNA polymerase domain-containing protein n=1 Tax=Halovivax sp. TaxID=1935978 RepID=UPI0025C3DDC6|nr:DNA polymerase domain-containing protein [Halovivax sp.]
MSGDRTPGPYTFEFEDGSVREWHLTPDGAEPELVTDYEPALFVAGPDDALESLRALLAADPRVTDASVERRYTTLHDTKGRADPERALRVALSRIGEVRALAHEIRGRIEREALDRAPGTLRLFDVDLAPGFRYCLDRGVDPGTSPPGRELRTLGIRIDERALVERDVTALRVDGETLGGEPVDVLESLQDRLDRADPDVLVLSSADLVPLLSETAVAVGLGDEFRLGRLAGWIRVAAENTYQSYGTVGHSPARYRVSGRAIVDESNSFLWHQSGLPGLAYMVESSGRPLQEAAWGSIGTLLTSRQIKLARGDDWGVLAPWNKWEPERFKDARTLHDADRGGFTFAPDVGLHENVHEIDFASLYPRIIREYNVSPETVDCACCRPDADGTPRDAVPELGYRICERSGFLPEVLGTLLDHRAKIKRRLGDGGLEESEARRLRGESGAIKWVLVSCFGYQGYRNAKFGRIECHEAINAYARGILLDAKDRLQAGGWRIVHGIVDSLWVTPRDGVDEPEPLEDVIREIGDEVGIALEHDGTYEWVCFVPLRGAIREGGGATVGGSNGAAAETSGTAGSAPATATPVGSSGALGSPAGALTKYFGKREGGEYKFRGIELRQRSTTTYVADRQREFVETLDAEREPAAVCDRLRRHLGELERGAVDPADLAITKRVSKRLEEYSQSTHTVAALERYEALDVARHPGQSVEYVVVDDDARRTIERVRLAIEGDVAGYDADYYATLLVRAAESVVSPLGWDRARIRRYLADGRTVRLSSFGG